MQSSLMGRRLRQTRLQSEKLTHLRWYLILTLLLCYFKCSSIEELQVVLQYVVSSARGEVSNLLPF